MKNLSALENTDEAIWKRWDYFYWKRKKVVGETSQWVDTILSKPLDEKLVHNLGIHSMFMILLPELDFSRIK
jgi:hypothetical protein